MFKRVVELFNEVEVLSLRIYVALLLEDAELKMMGDILEKSKEIRGLIEQHSNEWSLYEKAYISTRAQGMEQMATMVHARRTEMAEFIKALLKNAP